MKIIGEYASNRRNIPVKLPSMLRQPTVNFEISLNGIFINCAFGLWNSWKLFWFTFSCLCVYCNVLWTYARMINFVFCARKGILVGNELLVFFIYICQISPPEEIPVEIYEREFLVARCELMIFMERQAIDIFPHYFAFSALLIRIKIYTLNHYLSIMGNLVRDSSSLTKWAHLAQEEFSDV